MVRKDDGVGEHRGSGDEVTSATKSPLGAHVDSVGEVARAANTNGCRSHFAASWVATKNRLNQAAKRPRICQLPPSPIPFPRKRLKGGRMQMCATRRIVERSFVALPPRRPRRGKGGSRSPTLDVGYAGGMGVKDQSRALHRFYNAGHLESLDPCKVVSAPIRDRARTDGTSCTSFRP